MFVQLENAAVVKTESFPNCVTGLDRSLLRGLRAHPERYSVNLHTSGHVDGAVRGELGRG